MTRLDLTLRLLSAFLIRSANSGLMWGFRVADKRPRAHWFLRPVLLYTTMSNFDSLLASSIKEVKTPKCSPPVIPLDEIFDLTWSANRTLPRRKICSMWPVPVIASPDAKEGNTIDAAIIGIFDIEQDNVDSMFSVRTGDIYGRIPPLRLARHIGVYIFKTGHLDSVIETAPNMEKAVAKSSAKVTNNELFEYADVCILIKRKDAPAKMRKLIERNAALF